jgi:hypothetical protein
MRMRPRLCCDDRRPAKFLPFHKDELVARIHAIVRRSKGHAQKSTKSLSVPSIGTRRVLKVLLCATAIIVLYVSSAAEARCWRHYGYHWYGRSWSGSRPNGDDNAMHWSKSGLRRLMRMNPLQPHVLRIFRVAFHERLSRTLGATAAALATLAPDVCHVRTSEFHNVEGTNCRFRSLASYEGRK